MPTQKQKRAAQRRAQRKSEKAAAQQRKANQQKAGQKGKGGKKPVVMARPPAGWYDPNLDAQQRAAGRGLGDLVQDTATSRTRGATDFTLGGMDIARQRTELGEDVATQRTGVETGYQRNLSDLLTQRSQEGEDYTRNLAQLQRNYEQLGSAQTQSARAAGLSSGGAFAQSAAKRAANQAWEKAPIDTSHQRFLEASRLGETRLGEDKKTSLDAILRAQQRGTGALDRAGGQLNLGYQRTGEDLTTALERATRENVEYGQDVNNAKIAQAVQAGWNPTVQKPGPLSVGGLKIGGAKKKKKGKKLGTLIGTKAGGI